ncbi:S-layer homology domain-containing protein [Paenibacillus sp. JSM ZJ436]|uniref:S-layer homology domain-containing protein n=1 Tax=Paenibacillus sp. JSM ZJ436 TaxID=3376190 RepID=UPI00378B5B9F
MSFKRRNIHSNKVVSAVMAGLMVMGTGVSAEPAAPTAVSAALSTPVFSDVVSGYWGEKYIYKLAAQGIITGNNGKFRPNDPVTQQEAMTMAIRFLNLNVNEGTGTAATLPTNMKVNNYFVPYVSLALSQNLLNQEKESQYADDSMIWGAQTATREWITEVLIRSIGRTADAQAAMSEASGFADHGSISPDRAGYVNTAVELGLAQGVTANRFDPKGAVTRAQLATFFSRAQAYIDEQYENQYEGVVTSMSDGRVTLYTDGQSQTFSLQPSTAYFEKDAAGRITQGDIEPYTKVTVIAKDGAAAYVELMDKEQQLESFERKFERLSPDQVIWFDTGSSFESLSYTKDTLFLDQNGSKIDPADPKALVPGSVVTVQRETFTPQKQIVAITVKDGVVNKTATGVIQSVDLNGKKLTVQTTTGSAETYSYEGAIIKYQTQLLTPSELKAGAVVNYTVENSVLKSVEISQSVDRTVSAMLYSADPNGKFITYKRSGSTQLEIKVLASQPELIVSGIARPVLDDLIFDEKAGDEVELIINGDEQVTKITVVGRQSELMKQAVVARYDAAKKWLMVSDSAGKPHVMILDEKTKLESSAGSSLSAVEGLLGSGRKVNIKHLGNRALSLEVIYQYEGTLTEINTAAKTVTILTDNGETVKLPFSNPKVELYSKASASLSDIKIGDEVYAELSANQDMLASLKSKAFVQFEVGSVEPSLNRLTVKQDGVSKLIYTDKTVMSDENGQPIQLSALKPGSLVNVQFTGITPTSIQEVRLTLGQVMAVDAAANTLTVKGFNGTQQVISAAGGVKMNRGGAVSTSLAGLTLNDRVEVHKDITGVTEVKVLDSLSKTFWKSQNGEIYVKRTYTTDEYRFRTSSSVFVHQNDQNLSVQSLKENDNIVLYFNNGTVVEVVKQ